MKSVKFGNSILFHGRWQDVERDALPLADIVITDPPYGTTSLEWDKPVDWAEFFTGLGGMCKENPSYLIFCQMRTLMQIWKEKADWFRYSLVWTKTMPCGYLDLNRRPLKAFELVALFRENGLPQYEAQKIDIGEIRRPGKLVHKASNSTKIYSQMKEDIAWEDDGTRFLSDVLHFSNADRREKHLHPTQKPIELMRLLVRAYSGAGQTILDPYMGSGTTCLAAAMEGRNFIGIEQDAGYFEAAANRIKQWMDSPKQISLLGGIA